jgi:hypothetical protein
MAFIRLATLISYCVCMFANNVANVCTGRTDNCASLRADFSLETTTSSHASADHHVVGCIQIRGAGGIPARIIPSGRHHNEYGKFRSRHASSPFHSTADDSDDDDDDDSDLLALPVVPRDQSADPRHEAPEATLAGSQTAVLAIAQVDSPQSHAVGPYSLSLTLLQVRLQI